MSKNQSGAQKSPEAQAAKEEAERIGREFRRYRALVLSEVWVELRDAPGGPMTDSMNIVGRMMEEINRCEGP